MTAHWKAVLGVILIFAFGCVSGALCTSMIFLHRASLFLQRGPEAAVELMERRTTHNLDLDEQQKQQVHALFMENLKQRRLLQEQIQPQVRALNVEMVRQIDAVLHPDQEERFHENLAQFRKHFGKPAPSANASETPAASTNAPASIDAKP